MDIYIGYYVTPLLQLYEKQWTSHRLTLMALGFTGRGDAKAHRRYVGDRKEFRHLRVTVRTQSR